MLIIGVWVYPRRGAVYFQGTAVEDFTETGTHVHFWCWYHTVWFGYWTL